LRRSDPCRAASGNGRAIDVLRSACQKHGMHDARQDAASSESRSLADALVRVASQDRNAFEQVYSRTSAKLFGICLRILGNRSDAEGTLQDVYVTVWQKAAGYDPARASPVTWLATIARNKSIDRLRKRRDMRPIDDAVLQIADEAIGADALIERDEDRRRLADCLGELDDDQAGVIRSAFFGGVTYAQLAVRDSVPLGTLKSRIRRGLMRLRGCLER